MTCRTGRQPVREFTRNKTTQVSALFRLEAGECDHYTKGPVGGGGQCGGPDGMLLLRRHRLQRSRVEVRLRYTACTINRERANLIRPTEAFPSAKCPAPLPCNQAYRVRHHHSIPAIAEPRARPRTSHDPAHQCVDAHVHDGTPRSSRSDNRLRLSEL